MNNSLSETFLVDLALLLLVVVGSFVAVLLRVGLLNRRPPVGWSFLRLSWVEESDLLLLFELLRPLRNVRGWGVGLWGWVRWGWWVGGLSGWNFDRLFGGSFFGVYSLLSRLENCNCVVEIRLLVNLLAVSPELFYPWPKSSSFLFEFLFCSPLFIFFSRIELNP